MPVGIIGYGVYIPKFRIKVHEIARVWNEDGETMSRGLGISEKAVPGLDEDTTTMAVEAARNAVKQSGIDPCKIGALYVGSESHPYAVNPTASTVAEAIAAGPGDFTCADLEFACKAGTAGIQMCMGMVAANQIEYGIAIGSDTAQGRPGDALEYAAAAGACAVILGKDGILAEIEGTYSYSTDTPDFFRREGENFPSHGSRFTGKPAYFRHVINGAQGLMNKLGLTADDFDYACFHSPNGKFPIIAANTLQIPYEKVEPALVVRSIGNTYSASSMLSMARLLDICEPDQRILMVAYGSGAGSDAFSLKTTDLLLEKRDIVPKVDDYMHNKVYLDYAIYAKHRGKFLDLAA